VKAINRRIAGVLGAVLGAAFFAAPASAQEVSIYHPDAESRTFRTSVGGWTNSDTESGLCVPALTCPTPENTFEPEDGRAGPNDGHIRTAISGPAGAAGDVAGIWQSPSFVYNGAQGQQPTQIAFALNRKFDIADFLDVGGTSSTFTVEIVNPNTGVVAAVVFDNVPVTADVPEWTPAGPVDVAPGLLALGRTYAIRITSRFIFGSTVLPGATLDYDDVGFLAIRDPSAPGGPPGPPGPPGEGRFDAAFATSFINNNMRNWIGIRRGKGLVLVRCPGRARKETDACRFHLTVLWKRNGPPASPERSAAVAPKKKTIVALPIRGQFRDQILTRDMVLVRYRFRAGSVSTTVYKQLRIINCANAGAC
jgi:hypothetical protein